MQKGSWRRLAAISATWSSTWSEVLEAQPAPVQAFLLATSWLPRLSGELCDAVTGRDDGALMLEQLERANLFLVPLGSERGRRWYRYHALFGEAMRQHARQRLGEAGLRELHEHAGCWYEAQGMLHEAVDAALAAGQVERAAQIAERLLERGGFNELHTLRRWVDLLPDDLLDERPLICLAYAGAVLFTEDRYVRATAMNAEGWLRRAESAWRAAGDAPRLGQVAALRASVAFWQGDLPRAIDCAREALDLLADHDVLYRGISVLFVGQGELRAGRIDAAQRFAMEGQALCEAGQNIHGTLAAVELLADLCYQQGAFEQAAHYYQRALGEAVGGAEMHDDQSYALIGMAEIAYERDDLATAEQHAMRALDLARQRGAEWLHAPAALILARVQHARRQGAQALAALQALAAQMRLSGHLRDVQTWQAHLAIAAGDLQTARRWQAALAPHPDQAPRMQQEREALTVARLRLAQGDAHGALELLEGWRADAAEQGRTRSEIEILTLAALAHFALGDLRQAEPALARALALGQPRGFRRIFLDAGAPLAELLQAVAPRLTRRALTAYAAALLHALMPGPALAAQSGRVPLPEPLSPQEQRVLRLLAAGNSNAEIACALVVSTNTVKTHVKSIYRKLSVSTREEAQAAARVLDLR